MTEQNGNTHVHGPTGALVTGGSTEIKIQMPCPGPEACPHMREPWENETRLIDEFTKRVGICCPRGARLTLGKLIGEFTPRELRIAWKENSLQWNAEANELRFVTPWIEAAMGWGFISSATCFFAYAFISAFLKSPNNLSFAFTLCAGSLMYAGAFWLAVRYLLWPRRIAIRVRNRLAVDAEPRETGDRQSRPS